MCGRDITDFLQKMLTESEPDLISDSYEDKEEKENKKEEDEQEERKNQKRENKKVPALLYVCACMYSCYGDDA